MQQISKEMLNCTIQQDMITKMLINLHLINTDKLNIGKIFMSWLAFGCLFGLTDKFRLVRQNWQHFF